jgi:hypothetical protein
MKNKFSIALSLAVVLAMLITSLALADTITPDADAITVGDQPSQNLGNVAPGATLTPQVSFTLVCNGQKHVDNGQSINLTFTLTGATVPAGGSLTATNASIGGIPSTWPDDPASGNGDPCPATPPIFPDNGNSNVTIVAPTTPGTYTYSFKYLVSLSPAGNQDSSSITGSAPVATFTLTVVGDTTPPVISYTLTPSSSDGNNGWYKSNVSLVWTVTDPESAVSKTGCVNQNITADQAATTYSCSATSAGGSAGPVSVTIKRDATAPTISGAPTTSPNGNGWYNSDVTVHFNCSDSMSLIATCTSDQTLSGDGSNQSVPGTAVDNAGNSALATVSGINIDKTAPSISASPTPGPNANGWNNTDVTVSYICTDGGSGVDAAASSLSNDVLSVSGTASGTCVDLAGNSASASYTAQIDKVGPSVSATPTPSSNANGWNNTDVTISYVCTDSDSGVDASASDLVNDVLSASGTATGTCMDKAGNSATASYTAQIDKVKPVITDSRLPSANGNGWNNTDVTVSFICTDSGDSGIDINTVAGATLTGEGAGQFVTNTGTCTDKAGNTADPATVSDINIDKTAPTTTASPSPAPNANGWNNTDVTVSFSGSDSLSDIDFCDTAVVLNTEGAGQTASGTCTDNAGNVASATASNINIDKTAPTVSASALPAANANGWNNTDVTVSYVCSDVLAGVDTIASDLGNDLLTASGTATGTCVDNAGNSATASYTAQIDKVKPVITGSRLPAANANGWNNTDVVVSFTCADGGDSGIDMNTVAGATVSTEGAGQSVTNSGTCTDKAGNVADAATVSGISIDKTIPTATASPTPAANANGWNNTDVTVSFTGSDALSGIDTCSVSVTLSSEGAGQSASGTCTDKAGNISAPATATVNIDKTAPTLSPSVSPNPAVLNGSATANPGASDVLSGIDTASCATVDTSSVGPHSVNCTATDKAGNSASASASYSVQYAAGSMCLGAPGHSILQPINTDGSSVFKKGSTVPAKFRVCDANGISIGTPGVVKSFALIATNSNPLVTPNESIDSTTPDTAFRWSATDQQWIFNMNTKNSSAGVKYTYQITLNDGSTIVFSFTLK